MKSQKYNQGELKELKVNIDKDVVVAFETMSKNSGIKFEDMVVIAMMRYRAHHSDYEKKPHNG
jgi:hypothetical protein